MRTLMIVTTMIVCIEEKFPIAVYAIQNSMENLCFVYIICVAIIETSNELDMKSDEIGRHNESEIFHEELNTDMDNGSDEEILQYDGHDDGDTVDESDPDFHGDDLSESGKFY